MPRKNYGKKISGKGRRRLGGPGSGRRPGLARAAMTLAPRVATVARRARAYAQGKKYYSSSARKTLASANLMVGDNITTLPMTVIGKPRKPTFAEKVASVERPPILFKRNYQFSVECLSGRKAWFNIGLNHYNTDLNQDLTTYKSDLTTDTSAVNPALTTDAITDKARFYIDYMSSKLQFMNSGTNALTGKIHLFAYKRDCASTYASNVPVNPVNLMMFYSAFGRPLQTTNNEASIGNGWNFDSVTANSSYVANYNMPGSSVNSAGVCAFTDLGLSPMSSHVKRDISFWFRHKSTQSFSLKPGQQLNKVFKFHDLPEMARELLDYQFFDGISFALAVEFQGQVVGAIDTANLVSTGSAQLSIIREDIRILGQKNGLKPKVMLQTSPLTTILKANQTIINPDSGTVLNGFTDDA